MININVDGRILESRWNEALENDDVDDYQLMIHVGLVTATGLELIHCCIHNAQKIAKYLVEICRVDPNYANPNNPHEYNAFEYAVSSGNIQLAEYLRQKGAKPSGRQKRIKLHGITTGMVDSNSEEFSPMAMAITSYVLAMGYIPEYDTGDCVG